MKALNFEKIFKIVVLLQLTIILLLLLFTKETNNSNTNVEQNEIGRYKGIVIKSRSFNGPEEESVQIIDTKTGDVVTP